MKGINRRYFLMTSLVAASSRMARSSGPLGANSRIRVAVVGLRGRGRAHMRDFAELKRHNVEVAALCDVDESILNERVVEAEELTGKKPQSFVDLRQLLEEKEIDAISFATPNHWHALNTIWGPVRRARTSISKNPAPMAFGRGERWWKLLASTAASSRSALRTAAVRLFRKPWRESGRD